jgi:hypothetical protein
VSYEIILPSVCASVCVSVSPLFLRLMRSPCCLCIPLIFLILYAAISYQREVGGSFFPEIFCCCLFYGKRNNNNNPSSAQYVNILELLLKYKFFFFNFLVHENVQRITLRKIMALARQYSLSLTSFIYHNHFLVILMHNILQVKKMWIYISTPPDAFMA